MINFSKTERLVLVFLSTAIILGAAAHVIKIKMRDPCRRYNAGTINAMIPERKIVNINTAGFSELSSLKGIGPAIAGRIIDYRETNGTFKSKDELMKVKGIGPKKYTAIEKDIER